MKRPERSIGTILFTDIVGSTTRAAELGDRGWHELLEQHHTTVRQTIRRWGGREVNEAGDGFLALFDNPAHALFCAVEIRDRVRDLGLEVRCGAHLGEIERKPDGSIGGIAVHVGHRVSAAAGAGEVLVTSTLRDAEAGSGFGFEDRGRHELKGVPRPWRLFAVTAVPEPTALSWRQRPWVRRTLRRVAVGAFVGALVFGLAGLYVVTQDGAERFAPPPALASAAPGIAVLPFTVRGEDLDVWREGMVDLLSTGLDDVAELRGLPPRTVLARWDEQVADRREVDLPTALAIARAAGGKYAVVGSAVAIGPEVRLAAEVYELGSGESIGQARVEGAPESVLTLVDRLAVEIVQVILEEGEDELPRIDLASLTSDSTEALRAYLAGEVALRHFDLTAAEEAYQRAVDADSMFALAHFRLASVLGWEPREVPQIQRYRDHIDRAARLADRLPEREAMLVRARRALAVGNLDGVELLRDGVRRYPDDAEVWFHLGDQYFHLTGALATTEEIELALERSVELDPRNGRNLNHLVDIAIDRSEPADSARVASLVERFGELSPDSDHHRRHELLFALVYGDSLHRADATNSLDALGPRRALVILDRYLTHPRHLESVRAIVDAAYRNGDEGFKARMAQQRFVLDAALEGQLEEALEHLNDPVVTERQRAVIHWITRGIGLPVSDLPIEGFLQTAVIDSTTPLLIVIGGTGAADHGRWGGHRAAIVALAELRDKARARGDSLGARIMAARREVLRGYGLWRRGQPKEALSHLEDFWWDGPFRGRLAGPWLGKVYLELGRPEDAEPIFSSHRFVIYPLYQYHLGQIYEQLEEYDKAREAYQYFVEYWRHADPELQPMVEEARQAIIRLQG